MKKLLLFAVIVIGSIAMISCQSENKKKLIGVWETNYHLADSEDNVDYTYDTTARTTFKDDGKLYENVVATYAFTIVDDDYTTVMKFVYDINSSGTWTFSKDSVTISRDKVKFEPQSTEFHRYSTDDGEEVVPDTEYKNTMITETKKGLNDGLEEIKKEMTEAYLIISIDDDEMQMEDVDGIQLYKRVH